MQMASVLASLHGQGMVHMDVKPDNIMVGDDGAFKLGDFGLAARLDGNGGSITEGDSRWAARPRLTQPGCNATAEPNCQDTQSSGCANDHTVLASARCGSRCSDRTSCDIVWDPRRYVAREVLNDDRRTLDKADIFALGASMYELAGNMRLPDSAGPTPPHTVPC